MSDYISLNCAIQERKISHLEKASGKKKLIFNEKYDVIIILDRESIPEETKLKHFIQKTVTILKQALGTRVFKIDSLVPITSSVIILNQNKKQDKLKFKHILNGKGPIVDIYFGLILNPDRMFDHMELGPSGDTSEAREFRKFWGQKSHLRRFKEGAICETVFWNAENTADRRGLIGQIVKYILSSHRSLKICKKNIRITGSEMDCFLFPGKITPKIYGTGEERISEIINSFDLLSKRLRSLTDLPLTISKIQGVSSILRGTHPFPPKSYYPHYPKTKFDVKEKCYAFNTNLEEPSHPPYIEPINVIVGMETSGKWPNELTSLRYTKTAFYVELSQQLNKQFGIISKVHLNYLDIWLDSLAFRIYLACNKELVLLRQNQNSSDADSVLSKEADLLESFTVNLPVISSAINGVNSRFSAFSSTCRLVKRWLSSHFLLNHINEIALELMVAHLFLDPSPHTIPLTPVLGFLRFLRFIVSFTWETSPLIIDFNGDLKQEDIDEIKANFDVRRKELPLVFIATRYDKFLSTWTKEEPSLLILRRIIFVAKKCYYFMQKQLKSVKKYDFLPLFHSNQEIFDVTINLNKKYVSNFHLNLSFTKHKPLEEEDKESKISQFSSLGNFPIVGYNPVDLYLGELNKTFSEYAIFFYDRFGGSKIFVLWKPNVFESKPLLFKDSKYFKVIDTVSKSGLSNIQLDIYAILAQIKLLGGTLVQSVNPNLKKVEMLSK